MTTRAISEGWGKPRRGRPKCAYYSIRADKNTFTNDKVRNWVESWLPEGPVLNACAGETVLDHPQVHRNDLCGGTEIDTNLDVRDLSELDENQFAAVIYDPPYSPGRAEDLYGSSYPGYGTAVKHEFDRVLKPGGVLIQLGWSGVGMPVEWGYERQAVAFFNLLGRQTDWFGVVDRNIGERVETSAPRWKPYSQIDPHTVAVNDGAGPRTDQGTTEELDFAVRYSDSPIPENPLNNAAVREVVEPHLEGRVLVPLLSGQLPTHSGFVLQNDGNIDSTTLAGFARGNRPDSRIPLSELTETYADVFETILFAPPKSYFSRCYFEDGENRGGVDADCRDQFDTLLQPGSGKVVQVAHTATNMPGSKGYTREAVSVIAPVSEFGSTSPQKRATPPITVVSVDKHPDKPSMSPLRTEPYYLPCIHCGERFEADPVTVKQACPTCGANHDELCVDAKGRYMTDGHEPVFHERRRQALSENHPEGGKCPVSETGRHRVEPEELMHLPNPNSTSSGVVIPE